MLESLESLMLNLFRGVPGDGSAESLVTPPLKFLPLLLCERLQNNVVVVAVETFSTITFGRVLRSETGAASPISAGHQNLSGTCIAFTVGVAE